MATPSKRRVIGLVLVIFCLLGCSVALAADPPIPEAAEIPAARDAYWKSISSLRRTIGNAIVDRDARERAKPNADLKVLDGLKADREALDIRGEVPQWAQTPVVLEQYKSAQVRYLAVLKTARAALIRAKMDDQAKSVDDEMNQISSGPMILLPPEDTNVAPTSSGKAPPAPPFTPRTINLLPLIHTDVDSIHNGFTVTADGLQAPSRGRLRIPYCPPDEYDFIVEFTSDTDKGQHIGAICAVGDHSFACTIHGTDSKIPSSLVGIPLVEGTPNPTNMPGAVIKAGKRQKLIVQVRRDSVATVFDDRVVGIYRTDYSGFSLGGDRGIGQMSLGLSSHEKCTFNRVELLEITGPGRALRHVEKADVGKVDNGTLKETSKLTRSLPDLQPVAIQFESISGPDLGNAVFRKGDDPAYPPIVVDGQPCKACLYAPTPCFITYPIPRGAIGFRAVGTLPAQTKQTPAAEQKRLKWDGTFHFVVRIDGDEAFVSKKPKDAGGRVDIACKIPPTATRLEISAIGEDAGQAVFVKPEFVMGPVPPPEPPAVIALATSDSSRRSGVSLGSDVRASGRETIPTPLAKMMLPEAYWRGRMLWPVQGVGQDERDLDLEFRITTQTGNSIRGRVVLSWDSDWHRRRSLIFEGQIQDQAIEFTTIKEDNFQVHFVGKLVGQHTIDLAWDGVEKSSSRRSGTAILRLVSAGHEDEVK